MVNELRRKFIFVTMLLMLALLGVTITVYFAYNAYWINRDSHSMMEWLADSGIFTDADGASSRLADEVLFQDEFLPPVTGIITDASGESYSVQMLGDVPEGRLDAALVRALLAQKEGVWKYRSYVFARRALPDGRWLIVLTDTAFSGDNERWSLGNALIFLLAVLLLFGITNALSRYVTDPAKAALEREKRFVADASHELKTPLGAIGINAQALDKDEKNELYINNILSETRRMNRLIERLLTLSRIEEENHAVWETFSLSQAVEEIVLTYESVVYEKKIDFDYEIADGILIKGDADEWKQVVTILLDNAIKNAGADGRITVGLRRNQGGGLLVVSNTGAGILPRDLPHIFDRFYSSSREKDRQSFGLGLAIAKAIVDKHGGSIRAESETGIETRFTVVLPL